MHTHTHTHTCLKFRIFSNTSEYSGNWNRLEICMGARLFQLKKLNISCAYLRSDSVPTNKWPSMNSFGSDHHSIFSIKKPMYVIPLIMASRAHSKCIFRLQNNAHGTGLNVYYFLNCQQTEFITKHNKIKLYWAIRDRCCFFFHNFWKNLQIYWEIRSSKNSLISDKLV